MARELPAPLARMAQGLGRIEDMLLVVLLCALVVMAGLQIILRNAFGSGFTDMDGITRLMVLWLGLLGAVVAARRDKQISIDVLSTYLGSRTRHVLKLVVDLFSLAITAIVTAYAVDYIAIEYESGSAIVAGIKTWVAALIIPLSFGLISFHCLLFVIADVMGLVRISGRS